MRTAIWRHFDFWLLGAVAVLITFGVAMIRSTIAGNIELIELDIVGRQITYALIGVAVIVVAATLDYRLWISVSRVLYVLIALLLIVIILFGGAGERFGASRWLSIGLVIIQPSELAKITLIILLADFFARNRERIKEPLWVGRSILLTLGLVILILLQPNLSTSIVERLQTAARDQLSFSGSASAVRSKLQCDPIFDQHWHRGMARTGLWAEFPST